MSILWKIGSINVYQIYYVQSSWEEERHCLFLPETYKLWGKIRHVKIPLIKNTVWLMLKEKHTQRRGGKRIEKLRIMMNVSWDYNRRCFHLKVDKCQDKARSRVEMGRVKRHPSWRSNLSKRQRQWRVVCMWNSKKAGLASGGRNCGN